jgi:anti-sigma regulatory factor (Ser/Thr protein kinase)
MTLFRRTIASDLTGLAALLEELSATLRDRGVDAAAIHDAQLVCDELIGNVIRHGRRPNGGAPAIGVTVERVGGDADGSDGAAGRRIRITIRDEFQPFDPTLMPPPPRPASLAAAPVGGRGIAAVRCVAASFRWRSEGGGNLVEVELARGSLPT